MQGPTLIMFMVGVVLFVDGRVIDLLREKRNIRQQQPLIYSRPPQGIHQYQPQRPINSYPAGGYNQRPPIHHNQPGNLNGGLHYNQPGLAGNGFGVQKQPAFSGSQSSSSSQSLGGGHAGLSGSSSSSSSQSFSSGGGRGGLSGSSSQSQASSSSQTQGGHRGGSGSQSNASSNSFSGK